MLAHIHQNLKHSDALSVLATHFGEADAKLQEALAHCGVLAVRLCSQAEIWLDVDLQHPPISAEAIKVLVVQEPPDVKSLSLEGFDLVLTWQDEHLKQLGRRAELFVPATPWLLPAEWDQFAIKKLALGFLRGSKCRTAGHQLRHKIWEEQRHLEHSMQVPLNFMEGGGVSREQRNMQFFSSFVLVIENSRHKNYFSEKLLDALLARCIPVYWGCTNIGEFFDVAGFVVVEGENVEEALHNVRNKARHVAVTASLQTLTKSRINRKDTKHTKPRTQIVFAQGGFASQSSFSRFG
ncbi:unnamed protein product [Durusdinium trenchii]|uniref:Fucosyltransferase n=1 Tax=Durusdinium trenchii TaxID=1381693 RepID=A0ABP0Q2Q2_9DINO